MFERKGCGFKNSRIRLDRPKITSCYRTAGAVQCDPNAQFGIIKKKPDILNPLHPNNALIDFTLSNARRFYSTKGYPKGLKGLSKSFVKT